MMKFANYLLLLSVLFTACQNQPAPETKAADVSAITKHKYWVYKPFNEALFAPNVVDTLSYLECLELVFTEKDTVFVTSCLSDSGRAIWKATGPNTIELKFEGTENEKSTAIFDEKTGILRFDSLFGVANGGPVEFVAQDAVNPQQFDDCTINLGRERMAGAYTPLPQKGAKAPVEPLELRADGTQKGLGDFDFYQPWISGISGSAVYKPRRNMMYLVKKGREDEPVLAWQLRGDTLRLWETSDYSQEGDMPEYEVTKLKGIYLKNK